MSPAAQRALSADRRGEGHVPAAEGRRRREDSRRSTAVFRKEPIFNRSMSSLLPRSPLDPADGVQIRHGPAPWMLAAGDSDTAGTGTGTQSTLGT